MNKKTITWITIFIISAIGLSACKFYWGERLMELDYSKKKIMYKKLKPPPLGTIQEEHLSFTLTERKEDPIKVIKKDELILRSPTMAVFPPQKMDFRFFHNKHFIDMNIDCRECHPTIPKSMKSSDNNLPHIKGDPSNHQIICILCHKIFKEDAPNLFPPAACETCHYTTKREREPGRAKVVPVPRIIEEFPIPNINFPHKKHIDEKIPCVKCHKWVMKMAVATRNDIPTMNICLECHNGKVIIQKNKPPTNCRRCHLTDKNNRLKLYFPTGKIKPKPHRYFYHDAFWFKNHRQMARRESELCFTCHDQDWCRKCHDGSQKPPFYVHPNDWITLHPEHAKVRAVTCSSCHDYVAFCRDCHNQHMTACAKNPSPQDASHICGTEATVKGFSRFDSGNSQGGFHPIGWASVAEDKIETAGPEHHSRYARRNIGYCEACHYEKHCSTVSCHQAGRPDLGRNPLELPVNPHRGRRVDEIRKETDPIKDRSPAVCWKCHKDGNF